MIETLERAGGALLPVLQNTPWWRRARNSLLRRIGGEKHQHRVGARHRSIREELLSMELPRMARFYQISAAELDSYEYGEAEMPAALQAQMCAHFGVGQAFLDGERERPFDGHCFTGEEIDELLQNGASLVFFSLPGPNPDRLAYPLFTQGGDFPQSWTSRSYISLAAASSSVWTYIHALRRATANDVHPSVRVVQSSPEQWNALCNGRYFHTMRSPETRDFPLQEEFYTAYDPMGTTGWLHRMLIARFQTGIIPGA